MERIHRLCIFSILFFSCASQAITVGQIRNPSENFLDCDKVSSDVTTACYIAQDYVNQQLNAANISLENTGVVYRQVSNDRINLHKSCSHNTNVYKVEASLTLKDSASLRLSGNTLSKPAIFALKLPVEAYIRADISDQVGVKVFNGFGTSCVKKTDNLYADARVSTTANLLAMLSLEPKFVMSPEGDFIFALKPIFDIQASLSDTHAEFDIHGQNVLLQWAGAMTSVSNAAFSSLESALKGDSVEKIFVDPLVEPIISTTWSMLLTDYALSNPLSIEALTDAVIRSEASKSEAEINQSLTEATSAAKAKIESALNLSSDGSAYLVVGNDFKVKPTTQYHIDLIKPATVVQPIHPPHCVVRMVPFRPIVVCRPSRLL